MSIIEISLSGDDSPDIDRDDISRVSVRSPGPHTAQAGPHPAGPRDSLPVQPRPQHQPGSRAPIPGLQPQRVVVIVPQAQLNVLSHLA